MPNAVKGQRFGGRGKGAKNKATLEREERVRLEQQARQALAHAEAKTTALRARGKTELEEVLPVLKGVVAQFQRRAYPLIEGNEKITAEGEKMIGQLRDWIDLFIKTAAKLAEYQDPKLAAIAMAAPPPDPQSLKRSFRLTIFDGSRPAISSPPKPLN